MQPLEQVTRRMFHKDKSEVIAGDDSHMSCPNCFNILLVAMVLCKLALAHPPSDPNTSEELFTTTSICRLRIRVTETNIATLSSQRTSSNANQWQRPEVTASVQEDSRVFLEVALHLKGGSGSFQPIDTKPSLTVKFGQLKREQRFHGLSKISLNSSVQDLTRISEKLCREIYLKSDVPVPRADYAEVELNGRQLGLYVLTEGWNKTLLQRFFHNTKGNLYEPLQTQDVNNRLRVVMGNQPGNQCDLEKLATICTELDSTNRFRQLEQYVDMERFITFLAIECLTFSWDNYSLNRNNYRVFHDLEADRLVFMPHGMDQMFTHPEGPVIVGTRGLVSRAVLSDPLGWRRVLARIQQLRGSVCTPELLTNRVNEIATRIRPYVAKETVFAGERHDMAVASLNSRIVRRIHSVDEQLEGLKRLLFIRPGESASLTNWIPQSYPQTSASLEIEPSSGAMIIRSSKVGVAFWRSKIWLEAGIYEVQGMIKTMGVRSSQTRLTSGAGLRVWSPRKQNRGLEWSWFPAHESTDLLGRGEIAATNFAPTRLFGDHEWTPVSYTIDLREPVADLEVWCELRAASGEAWFDTRSLRITRK